MGLHIKREEACRLAAELAKRTGESKTEAVTVALRERLHRVRAQQNRREMRSIAERCASLMAPGPGSTEHGDWLYDERGLPK